MDALFYQLKVISIIMTGCVFPTMEGRSTDLSFSMRILFSCLLQNVISTKSKELTKQNSMENMKILILGLACKERATSIVPYGRNS